MVVVVSFTVYIRRVFDSELLTSDNVKDADEDSDDSDSESECLASLSELSARSAESFCFLC